MPALIWYPPSDCGRAAYDTVDCSISALPWVISRGVELRLNEEVEAMSRAGQKMAVVAFSPSVLERPRPKRPAIEKSDICTQSTTRSDGAHVVSRGVIPF